MINGRPLRNGIVVKENLIKSACQVTIDHQIGNRCSMTNLQLAENTRILLVSFHGPRTKKTDVEKLEHLRSLMDVIETGDYVRYIIGGNFNISSVKAQVKMSQVVYDYESLKKELTVMSLTTTLPAVLVWLATIRPKTIPAKEICGDTFGHLPILAWVMDMSRT